MTVRQHVIWTVLALPIFYNSSQHLKLRIYYYSLNLPQTKRTVISMKILVLYIILLSWLIISSHYIWLGIEVVNFLKKVLNYQSEIILWLDHSVFFLQFAYHVTCYKYWLSIETLSGQITIGYNLKSYSQQTR